MARDGKVNKGEQKEREAEIVCGWGREGGKKSRQIKGVTPKKTEKRKESLIIELLNRNSWEEVKKNNFQ